MSFSFLVSDPNDGRLRRSAAGSVVFTVSSQVVLIVFQLANITVLSRLLAPADFGLMAMSTTIIAFIGLFRDLGLSTATTQRQNLDQDTASGIFVVNLGMSFILMLIASAVGPIAVTAFDDARLATVMVVSSTTIPIAALGTQHAALLMREMLFMRTQCISVAAAAVGSIGAILLAVCGAGYWALLANTWLVTATQTVFLWVWSPWRPTFVKDWGNTWSALSFGLPLTGSGLIVYFTRQFDKVLVGWSLGGEDLGHYSRAYAILMLPQTLISSPVSSVLVPVLSRLQTQPQAWRDLLLTTVQLATTLSFLIGALLTVNANDVVAIVLGSDWERSADLVRIFGLSMIARAVMNQNPWIYISLGRTKRMMIWQVTTLPAYLSGIAVGLSYGLEGVALGFSVVQALLSVPSVFVAAACTPVSGITILRSVAPMGAVALGTILLAPLLSIPIELKHIGVYPALLNLTITSLIFAVGALLVLCLDPAYQRLRNAALTYSHKAALIGLRLVRESRK